MPFHLETFNKQFQLPLFGAVGLSTLVIVGIAAWFLFLRPKKKPRSNANNHQSA